MYLDQLALRITLTRRDHPVVKLLIGETDETGKFVAREYRKMSSRDALLMAHSEDFAWGGRAEKRVRWMRSLRKDLPWQACYRTEGSPSIPISREWGRRDDWRDLSAGEYAEICRDIKLALEGEGCVAA